MGSVCIKRRCVYQQKLLCKIRKAKERFMFTDLKVQYSLKQK